MKRYVARVSHSLRTRLRQETAPLHLTVERELDLLDPALTVDRYRRVLKAFWGFYAPVESRIRILAVAAPPLRLPLPDRTALIERDLIALRISRSELSNLPVCDEAPQLSSVADLAGCLYVLEGAALGGRIIARFVEARMGLDRERGAAFLSGDGEAIGDRWRRVEAWLGEVEDAGASPDQAVASAIKTFRALSRWARLQGATP